MRLDAPHVRRLEQFLAHAAQEAGAEPPTAIDLEITHRMVEMLFAEMPPPPGSRVLVLGSREGTVLELLAARGVTPQGVTWDPNDIQACVARGLDVRRGDATFLEGGDATFSLVWCRQSVERSVIPALAISEMYRVLQPGGLLYLEVPAPDTAAAHEARPGHRSILGRSMWLELLRRQGFQLLRDLDLAFTAAYGPDLRWAFVCQRPQPAPQAPPQSTTSAASTPVPQSTTSAASTPETGAASAPQTSAASTPETSAASTPQTSAAPQARPGPAPLQATASVYLALPVGSMHGWGICGKYLAREMAALTSVRLVTTPFTPEQVGGDLDHWELQRLLPPDAEAAALAASEEIRVDCPLLLGIGDENLRPGLKGGRGTRTVGYTFFETGEVAPEAIAFARSHYDCVATGSTWCSDILRSHGLDCVQTVIQGVDPAVFGPSSREREYLRDRFVIFSGGKFELRKGQDLVLRAVRVMQERHADVMLVASWVNLWTYSLDTMRQSPYIRFNPPAGASHAETMRCTLAQNGLDPARTVMLGPAPNAVMARIYHNSDVGLFPNRCEGGTNLVLMEYMACGKPAIASYSTGHRDVLTPDNSLRVERMRRLQVRGRDGRTTEWDDPDLDEIIDRLEWAYQERTALAALGIRAGQDLARYTWRATAETFLRLLTGDPPTT